MSNERDYSGDYWSAVRRSLETQIAYDLLTGDLGAWELQQPIVEAMRALLKRLHENESAARDAYEAAILRGAK